MCVYKITPMHSCTYKMQPIYYIAPYTEFLIATKLNQCYGGNAKPIALVGNYCRKTPQSKPGQCRGSMVQSTWLTTHPTLGPDGIAHILGSWVHCRQR